MLKEPSLFFPSYLSYMLITCSTLKLFYQSYNTLFYPKFHGNIMQIKEMLIFCVCVALVCVNQCRHNLLHASDADILSKFKRVNMSKMLGVNYVSLNNSDISPKKECNSIMKEWIFTFLQVTFFFLFLQIVLEIQSLQIEPSKSLLLKRVSLWRLYQGNIL